MYFNNFFLTFHLNLIVKKTKMVWTTKFTMFKKICYIQNLDKLSKPSLVNLNYSQPLVSHYNDV